MTKTVLPQELVQEDLYLNSVPSSVRIHLRHKRMASDDTHGRRGVVIFVHGATFSGVSAYDAPLAGGSWLDYVAARGKDVYAIDVRGYGLSSHPSTKRAGHWTEGTYAYTEEAVLDLSAAVDFVLERSGVEQVDLVGWSWGTSICGGYTARNNSKVRRLVMYAPIWLMRLLPTPLAPIWMPLMGAAYASTLAPIRKVTFEEVRGRWLRGLDARTSATLCPPEHLEAWWNHALSSDPASGYQSPRVLHAPNGVLADLSRFWAAGTPTYEPANIEVPVLTILGERDVDTPSYMAEGLFNRLTAARYKRFELLGHGTHWMCLETTRFQLYDRVNRFLEEELE